MDARFGDAGAGWRALGNRCMWWKWTRCREEVTVTVVTVVVLGIVLVLLPVLVRVLGLYFVLPASTYYVLLATTSTSW